MRRAAALLSVVWCGLAWAQQTGVPDPIKTIGEFTYRCRGSLAGDRATWPNEPGNTDGKSNMAYTLIYQAQCRSYIQGFVHGHAASARLSNAFTRNKAAVTHICPPAAEPPQTTLAKAIFGISTLQQTQGNLYGDDAPIETPLLTTLMMLYPCKDLPLGQPTPK